MPANLFSERISLFLVCFYLLNFSTERASGEFSVQRSSPRLVTVAEGQTIYLNITLNGTGDIVPMLVFLDWNFQTSNSRTMKRLLSVTWDQGYVVSEEFHDERASLLDNASLMLVDATLNDAGSYWCNAFSLPSKFYPVVYFNVSIKGKPRAEIGCSDQVNVTQGQNFSCWCSARDGFLPAKATWQMAGSLPFLDGKRRNGSVELFLEDVNKYMAGAYVCRAQLHSMVDETILTLSVLYPPKIRSFRGNILKDKSLKMTCLAQGFPRPTYLIKFSNGLTYSTGVDGVVVIDVFESNVNTSYTCIARNSVGEDRWHLNSMLTIFEDATVVHQVPYLPRHIWYIRAACIIAGMILGFLVLTTCQRIRGKRSETSAQDRQSESFPVYIDPVEQSMFEARMKNNLNHIDVHALEAAHPGGANKNVAVYVDPDTIISSRQREGRGEDDQVFVEVQAGDDRADDGRLHQLPGQLLKDAAEKDVEDNRAVGVIRLEDDIQVEDKVQANHVENGDETRVNNHLRSKHGFPPPAYPKSPAKTKPIVGCQDLESLNEVEENIYHNFRSGSKGGQTTEQYANVMNRE